MSFTYPAHSHRLALLAGLLLAAGPFSGCSTSTDPTEGREPGDCTNRADDDGDGAFDCEDEGCAGSPDCTADTGDADTDT